MKQSDLAWALTKPLSSKCRTDIPSHRHADEFAVAETETPGEFPRPADPDARIGHDLNLVVRPAMEAVPRIAAEIDLVMTLRNSECLGQLPGAGTETSSVFQTAPLAHDGKATPRLDRTNQNESIPWATLDQDIQHPVHAVVQIDVGRARFVALDEGARARALEGVRRLVAFDQVGFGLNDKAGALPPNELGADQVCGAKEWINLEENIGQHADKIAALLYGR